MIKNRLSAILGEKRITQKELSEMTGIRPNTINDMYHEMAERVSLDHLSRICEVLDIELSELLVYKPNRIKRDWENE
ncbi:helix-turn-helix transcriptional regulator [Eubacterium limosum]|uniref:helix-turn-helix domain-containing protein n=1 Tax=Eubacterium limosum TaxID=1736 RepID=UPI001D088C2A|nr:helix-turn-helix transcriptional regulator [Eubacterium limosum]MCB6569457.1 helix-turn-helix transcriptional regulator [Eubacterium limosum]